MGWTGIASNHPVLFSVQVKELPNPDTIFETILGLVVRLAEHGLIHCDFNEFNIMVSYFYYDFMVTLLCLIEYVYPVHVVFCNF